MDDLDPLVAAARAGGGWAFGRLWEALSPVVAGYLRGRGVHDPDDVTSEVFLAAFRGLGRFDGDGAAFRAWLFTIAHHKSVDARRRPANREVLLDSIDDLAALCVLSDRHGASSAQRSAEDEVMERHGNASAIRALNVLTEDQRAVVLLRVIGDLTLAETADVIGKPVGAVKSLQHRALGRLRAQLDVEAVSPAGDKPMTRTT